ncbi:MAG: ribonuclease HI family protein [Candidatus Aenigmatarchaeota archaeon]
MTNKVRDKQENVIKKDDILYIYTDGASRKNPGPSAIAYVFVKNNDEIIFQNCEYIGEKTNNQAEYIAIIKALEKATEFTRWNVKVFSDSELVIRQINGKYRIKNPELKKLCLEVNKYRSLFSSLEFYHVKRENKYIQLADKLCNDCLREYYENEN